MVLHIKNELTYPGTDVAIKKGDVVTLHHPTRCAFVSNMRIVRDRIYNSTFYPMVLLVVNMSALRSDAYMSTFTIGYDMAYGYEHRVNDDVLPGLYYPEGNKSIDIDSHFINDIFMRLSRSVLTKVEYNGFILYTDFVKVLLSNMGPLTFSKPLVNILDWPSEAILGWMKAYRPHILRPNIDGLMNADVKYKFIVEAQKSILGSIRRRSPYADMERYSPLERIDDSTPLSESTANSDDSLDLSIMSVEKWESARMMITRCIPNRLRHAVSPNMINSFCEIIWQYLNNLRERHIRAPMMPSPSLRPSPIRDSSDVWIMLMHFKRLSDDYLPHIRQASIQHLFTIYLGGDRDLLIDELRRILENEDEEDEEEEVDYSGDRYDDELEF